MDATTEFVLDNSVVMVWGSNDEADPDADRLLDLMPTSRPTSRASGRSKWSTCFW